MVEKRRFTDKSVNTIRLPAAGRKDLWDAESPLGLRLSGKGTRTYIVSVRIGGRSARRLAIGRVGEISLAGARKMAPEWKAAAKAGRNPALDQKLQRKQQHADTFSKMVERFLDEDVGRKNRRANTVRNYELTLKGKDVAHWRDRPVASIQRREIRDVVETIRKRAPIQANRALKNLQRFFAWLVETDAIPMSPATAIKPPSAECSRSRVLSDGEIVEVWNAANVEGGLFEQIVKLLVLTGQRRQEIAGITLAEIIDQDGGAPRLELPGDRTKNHRPHIVPLAPQAVVILKSVPRLLNSPVLFTSNGKTPVSGFSKVKRRIDRAIAEARKKAGNDKPMAPWTLHDLRRTAVTGMHERLHIQPHIVEAVINHISGHRAGVAGVYNRSLYADEKRAALMAWASLVESIVKKSTS